MTPLKPLGKVVCENKSRPGAAEWGTRAPMAGRAAVHRPHLGCPGCPAPQAGSMGALGWDLGCRQPPGVTPQGLLTASGQRAGTWILAFHVSFPQQSAHGTHPERKEGRREDGLPPASAARRPGSHGPPLPATCTTYLGL